MRSAFLLLLVLHAQSATALFSRLRVASDVAVPLMGQAEISPVLAAKHAWAAKQMAEHKNYLKKAVQGAHMVYIGDSGARYQYLHLAHMLRTGQTSPIRFFEDAVVSGGANLRHSNYTEFWHQFYSKTNEAMGGKDHEVCDCYRGKHLGEDDCEHRLFHDKSKNVSLSYFQYFGPMNTIRGHVAARHPEDLKCAPGRCAPPFAWNYRNVSEFTQSYIETLQPPPTHVIIDSGYWGFLSYQELVSLFEWGNTMVRERGMQMTWRTTHRTVDAAPRGSYGTPSKGNAFQSIFSDEARIQQNELEKKLATAYGWSIHDWDGLSANLYQTDFEDKVHWKDEMHPYLSVNLLRTWGFLPHDSDVPAVH